MSKMKQDRNAAHRLSKLSAAAALIVGGLLTSATPAMAASGVCGDTASGSNSSPIAIAFVLVCDEHVYLDDTTSDGKYNSLVARQELRAGTNLIAGENVSAGGTLGATG